MINSLIEIDNYIIICYYKLEIINISLIKILFILLKDLF